jgi:ribosomal protein S18 acetylase RimI-like enzyme
MPERQFRHQLRRGAGRLRVAMAGPRLLGYALTMFRAGTRVARLYSISVDPAARGQGLGARLLADAERGARARGCERLRLEVRVHNRRAIALYESRGYLRFARRVGYYQDGTDAFRYEKHLVGRRRNHPE